MAKLPKFVKDHQRLHELEPDDVDYIALAAMKYKYLNYELLYERFFQSPKLSGDTLKQMMDSATTDVQKKLVWQALKDKYEIADKLSKQQMIAITQIERNHIQAAKNLVCLQNVRTLFDDYEHLFDCKQEGWFLNALKEAVDCLVASKSQDT